MGEVQDPSQPAGASKGAVVPAPGHAAELAVSPDGSMQAGCVQAHGGH
jgi:hypothetical protein